MPKQGLNEAQVKAVAQYIMNVYQTEEQNGTATYMK
jgi:mono/diheme cytochrome c family protein